MGVAEDRRRAAATRPRPAGEHSQRWCEASRSSSMSPARQIAIRATVDRADYEFTDEELGVRAGRSTRTFRSRGSPVKRPEPAARGPAATPLPWRDGAAVRVKSRRDASRPTSSCPLSLAPRRRVLHLGTSVADRVQRGTGAYGISKIAFRRLAAQCALDLGGAVLCGRSRPGVVDTEGSGPRRGRGEARPAPRGLVRGDARAGAAAPPASAAAFLAALLLDCPAADFGAREHSIRDATPWWGVAVKRTRATGDVRLCCLDAVVVDADGDDAAWRGAAAPSGRRRRACPGRRWTRSSPTSRRTARGCPAGWASTRRSSRRAPARPPASRVRMRRRRRRRRRRRAAEAAGLRARCLVDAHSRTTTVCPVVDAASGERAIFWTADGCAPSPDFAAAQLPELFRGDDAWLSTCRVLYVPGWFLYVPGAADRVVALAKQRPDLEVAVNLAGADLVANASAALLDVLRVAAFVFGNESEYAALAPLLDKPGAVVAARALGTWADATRTVLATFGPDPTVLAAGDDVATFPVPPVETVVDTTGAGDAFAGAYLAAHVDGAPPAECVRCGHKAAANVLGQAGAAPSADFH
ncbi:adenosine kinase [Aureococcus anophagefferens]|nr:adenosine kinase [Aureococcus anophagefferens]